MSSKENSSGASAAAPVSLASTLSGNSTRLSFDIGSVRREDGVGEAAIVGGITRNQPVFHPNTRTPKGARARARACVCVTLTPIPRLTGCPTRCVEFDI